MKDGILIFLTLASFALTLSTRSRLKELESYYDKLADRMRIRVPSPWHPWGDS